MLGKLAFRMDRWVFKSTQYWPIASSRIKNVTLDLNARCKKKQQTYLDLKESTLLKILE